MVNPRQQKRSPILSRNIDACLGIAGVPRLPLLLKQTNKITSLKAERDDFVPDVEFEVVQATAPRRWAWGRPLKKR